MLQIVAGWTLKTLGFLGGGSKENCNEAVQVATKADSLTIVRDHIWFAHREPERVAAIASWMGISTQSATAFMIAEQVCEELHFYARK